MCHIYLVMLLVRDKKSLVHDYIGLCKLHLYVRVTGISELNSTRQVFGSTAECMFLKLSL